MSKRTFIKSLFATAAMALVPTKLFAQEKKQSTINGIPVDISGFFVGYIPRTYETEHGAYHINEAVLHLKVMCLLPYKEQDKLIVNYAPEGIRVTGNLSQIYLREEGYTLLILNRCSGNFGIERCVVV